MLRFDRLFSAIIVGGLIAASVSAEHQSRQLVKLNINGRTIEAAPLLEASDGVLMLARDGRVLRISTSDAKNARTTTSRFTPLSASAMRSQLEAEFGHGFTVTATGHYLVVHPKGYGAKWSQRFEDLYRSFRHYFSVRGFSLDDPEFPLVAIVFPSAREFHDYAKESGDRLPSGVLGYYSPNSNRVLLYDQGAGNDDAWSDNAATIIHEATHQTAFNTGIHARLFATPNWIVEGLGTMFEAEGVWDSRHNARSSDRINKERLEQFKRYVSRRKEDAFVNLLAGDGMFRSDPDGAYAESWAWTYYLMETRPRQFAKYIKRVTSHKEFSVYSAEDRLDDFAAEFGGNFKHLDAQFVRHMEALK